MNTPSHILIRKELERQSDALSPAEKIDSKESVTDLYSQVIENGNELPDWISLKLVNDLFFTLAGKDGIPKKIKNTLLSAINKWMDGHKELWDADHF